ncbi:hypothetical transmembrane protein DUF6 [Psychromonas ingrahamii 37]|uniref:Hypothetical transmembrane protein DUF6 n=1 Tax=Psychromonas ingrahamii (strain DSM 17664 / CCUG 51855 / 37) TaxID=357804 RepID=A1SWN3_PSYIN|nr:EamA family transporter [Psychromonas ingrahamii]ABM03898.1 hypothetical transmembrane protein DUF6 [Psychromonas ingrahamii 37]
MSLNNISEKQIKNGRFAVLLAAILWGTTGTVASFAPQLSPLAIGAFAMGIGGLLQAMIARKKLISDIDKLLTVKRELLIGALAVAIYPLAFYTAMQFSGITIGTVISIATAPFATVLLERLLSKKNHMDRRWQVSVGLGVIGVVLLTYSEGMSAQYDQQNALKFIGALLGLLAGLTYAIYSWVARSLIEKGIQSESAMGSLFALGAAILIPSLFFTGENLFSNLNNILVVSYMALVPMFIGYLAFGFGLRYVHASRATLLTLFEPVVAAVLAVSVVGEHIAFSGWLGMLLIITCLFLQTRAKSTTVI